jgi:predicted Zn-dependent protease
MPQAGSRTAAAPARAAVALALAACGCAELLTIEKGGFNLVSLDEEWAMREDLARQVASEFRLVRDPEAVAYLESVGRRIVAQTDLADRPWDFGIVDDDAVNAFNLPGGLVYVHKGLVAEADALDELTAVMGHEIAHGVARHGTQLMTRAAGVDAISGILLGNDADKKDELLRQIVGGGVLSRYSREAEREADQLGIRYAAGAGYDPAGAARMFRKLLALRGRKPSSVERFFSSHPLTEERIAEAEALARQLPRGSSMVHDTQDYQRFRRKLGVGG